MKILTKSKQFIKSAAITGSVVALFVAPSTAFAHGNSSSGGDSSGHRSSSQMQSSHDKNKGTKSHDDNARHKRDKQQTCAERQAALNQKATAFHDRSTKKLNGLNIVYSGVQTYATSGSVTVENYDTLKAEADASGANATIAVNAITAPQLNCDDSSSQSQQDDANNSANATLNSNIKAAKDSLAAYRHDVMTIFNAAIDS